MTRFIDGVALEGGGAGVGDEVEIALEVEFFRKV